MFQMYDDDHQRLLAVVSGLVENSSAKAIYLIDRTGQLLCEAGELQGLDTTGLASLAAGSIAATSSLAELLGESEFGIHFHQGQRDHLHMSNVGQQMILVVVFDEQTSLGLVRLRVRRASSELLQIIEEIEKRNEAPDTAQAATPLSEITDEDIDNLFSS